MDTRTHTLRQRTLALLALLLAPGLARPGTEGTAPSAGETAAAVPAPLAAALDAVRPRALAADAAFLAADELGGRDTPSPGLRAAAGFLRARVERLGFRPGAADGWTHEYVLHRRRIDPVASRLVLRSARGERRLGFGAGYCLERVSQIAEVAAHGPLVSIGEGSSRELEGVELSGHWALALDAHRSPARMAQRVAAGGGVGLVLVPAPGDEDTASGARFATTMRTAREGVLAFPGSARTFADPEVPVLVLDGRGVLALAALAGEAWRAPTPEAGVELAVTLTEVRTLADPEVLAANVCAYWPGTDKAREAVVVSAHYDHVGASGDEVYNGADDNASGSATLLAVAEGLAAHGPLHRSVLLLWLSGEEHGLWGSQAWVADPWLPGEARPVADLNLDMVGRNAADELYLTPTAEHASSNPLARLCAELAPDEGFPELRSQDEHWRRSDHYSFARTLGIPVAFLSSGDHEDYHRPSDTADKLDAEKMARVARLVLRVLDAVDTVELPAVASER